MNSISFSTYHLYKRKLQHKRSGVISMWSTYENKGTVLISYVTHPFRITQQELDETPHTNPFECLEIVNTFLEMGYNVDIIDWTNTTFVPKKSYDAILDVHQNIGRLRSHLPAHCKKIFYITGAHWLFQNTAENNRLHNLSKRRGIALTPRRNIIPAQNIEYADYAIALGSRFAADTYAFSKKDITLLPLFGVTQFPKPEKNFEQAKKHFVWIGGGGAVHKGLDLVLDCFKELPHLTLTICGPVNAEKDFVELYKKELQETSNIKTVGRINVRSQQFKDIVSSAAALIYPSCSEGQSGSVITSMHAGLIPIVSFESGVDVVDFGIMLKENSLEEIRRSIIHISELPATTLQNMSEKTWDNAQQQHSREMFKSVFSKYCAHILKP